MCRDIRRKSGLKRLLLLVCAAASLGVSSATAHAQAPAQALYQEIDLGGGLWQYDYTLYNNLDPVAFAGYDLFNAVFNFSPGVSAAVPLLPPGWDSILGVDSIEVFSVFVGPPPAGNDIPPGAALSGFRFQFNARVGDLPFTMLFDNPNDPGTPLSFSGISARAAVPEPGACLILASALPLLGMVARRRRG